VTKLLISVRSAEEARAALEGGADVIDVKEPRRGTLGAADPAVWRTVRGLAGPQAVVSAALGELVDEAVFELASQSAGLDFVKIGLAQCGVKNGWTDRWSALLNVIPAGVCAVPVAYADWSAAGAPSPAAVLALASLSPGGLLLVDTYDKSGGGLLDCLSVVAVKEFISAAHRASIRVAVAGSLDAETIARLLPLAPDYIGVRGAACRSGRDGAIDLARVKYLAQVVAVAAVATSA
jgi:hypothetical protein